MPFTTKPLLAAGAFAAALLASACSGGPTLNPGTGPVTGSLGSTSNEMPPPPGEVPRVASAKPAGKSDSGASTLELARSLRKKGDKAKALAEIERGRREKPADRELAREAGLVALELGQIDRAKSSLEAALDKQAPDWHTLSALGTLHASSGNQKEAQAFFRKALELRPDHQPTLNNLAMSYALQGDLAKAEKTLRGAMARGSATPQVQENLALVLALAGKYEDAEKVALAVMPKEKAVANLAYLRSLKESKESGG